MTMNANTFIQNSTFSELNKSIVEIRNKYVKDETITGTGSIIYKDINSKYILLSEHIIRNEDSLVIIHANKSISKKNLKFHKWTKDKTHKNYGLAILEVENNDPEINLKEELIRFIPNPEFKTKEDKQLIITGYILANNTKEKYELTNFPVEFIESENDSIMNKRYTVYKIRIALNEKITSSLIGSPVSRRSGKEIVGIFTKIEKDEKGGMIISLTAINTIWNVPFDFYRKNRYLERLINKYLITEGDKWYKELRLLAYKLADEFKNKAFPDEIKNDLLNLYHFANSRTNVFLEAFKYIIDENAKKDELIDIIQFINEKTTESELSVFKNYPAIRAAVFYQLFKSIRIKDRPKVRKNSIPEIAEDIMLELDNSSEIDNNLSKLNTKKIIEEYLKTFKEKSKNTYESLKLYLETNQLLLLYMVKMKDKQQFYLFDSLRNEILTPPQTDI
jgi:hypothetical protein